MIEPHVVLGHVLAMVAEENDHGLVEETGCSEVLEESTDLVVEIRNFGVVEVGDVFQTGDDVEVVVQVLGEQGIGGPVPELVRDEGVSTQRRGTCIEALVRLGWKVRDVRVPKVQEQEECLVAVFVQPLGPHVDDDGARRPGAAGRRHVILVPPQEPVLHRKEMIDGSRRVAGAAEDRRQPRELCIEARAAGWKCETMFVVTPNLPVKMAVWDGCVGMSDANALVKRDPSPARRSRFGVNPPRDRGNPDDPHAACPSR